MSELPMINAFKFSCPKCKGTDFEAIDGDRFRCRGCDEVYDMEDFSSTDMLTTRPVRNFNPRPQVFVDDD